MILEAYSEPYQISKTELFSFLLLTYISTGNFLSLIPVSDWLIFCGGILILNQKKRNENDKKQIFW